MRKFHQQVLDVVTRSANRIGGVHVRYADVAREMPGTNSGEVHEALLQLRDAGEITSLFATNDSAEFRVPAAAQAAVATVITALRTLEDPKTGRVASSYSEVATKIGGALTPPDVHELIVHLKEDGFFEGHPTLTFDHFELMMPEED